MKRVNSISAPKLLEGEPDPKPRFYSLPFLTLSRIHSALLNSVSLDRAELKSASFLYVAVFLLNPPGSNCLHVLLTTPTASTNLLVRCSKPVQGEALKGVAGGAQPASYSRRHAGARDPHWQHRGGRQDSADAGVYD